MVNREDSVPGTLVIQPLPGIGDMVWHLPYLRAIAQAAPEGRITLLTKRRSLADQLFSASAIVEEVLWLERRQGEEPVGRHDGPLGSLRLARDLRPRSFESVWILHGSRRYAWACRLAGIANRVGYRDLPADQRRLPPFDKARALLQAHGLTVDQRPHFTVPKPAQAWVDANADRWPRPWLAIGIGASEPFKQWGSGNFAALTRAFTDRTGGSVFLVGGPAEIEPANAIVGRSRGSVNTVLDRPLGEVAALCANADAFIGNDTGILNLAAATGTPCVGLFGGSPPLTIYPNLTALEPPGGAVYRVDRMAEVEVEEAMQAVNAILDPRVLSDHTQPI